VLGAAIASADIHLSPEIAQLQHELRARISLARTRLDAHEVRAVCAFPGPIVFVGTIELDVALEVAVQLQRDGFWINAAGFSATPRNGAGVRFTLSRHVTSNDIMALTNSLAHHLPRALERFGLTHKRVSDAPAYQRVSAWPVTA